MRGESPGDPYLAEFVIRPAIGSFRHEPQPNGDKTDGVRGPGGPRTREVREERAGALHSDQSGRCPHSVQSG
ncbi:hypothetical protein Ntsu_14060 [Nocardia sp. IFM 10818]